MLKALLTHKKIRAQVLVNETTALELASGGRCKLMVSLLLKCEHINYSQQEIDKAFYNAHQANSPSVEIFLDDYFEQIIAYPNDIQQNFQKNLWVLELLGKEANRRYLFNKLINYLSQSDDACNLKLLGEVLNSCQESSSQQHPFVRILTIEPRPAKQTRQTLFSTTESELEQLQKYYQTLNRANVANLM